MGGRRTILYGLVTHAVSSDGRHRWSRVSSGGGSQASFAGGPVANSSPWSTLAGARRGGSAGKVHGSVPIHTFSRVGFSRDGSQAMVYDAWQGDWLAGEGRIVVLTRTADGWRELYEIPLWVS